MAARTSPAPFAAITATRAAAGKATRWWWTSPTSRAKTDYRGARETCTWSSGSRAPPTGLRYEVSVDDPRTWSKPWTAALDLTPQSEAMFEYACHEGNNSMRNILSGARAARTK